jgi:flagellar motor switch protein FliN/FliY
MTTQTTDVEAETLVLEAAARAAAALPSVHPLTAAGAQPGNADVAAAFHGAVVASLGTQTGRVAVLVGEELTAALAASPTPGTPLAGALQPTVDAIAAALGTTAGAAVEVTPDALVDALGAPFTVVPLIGTGFDAAVAVTDDALRTGSTSAPEAPLAAAPPAPAVDASTVTHEPLPTPATPVSDRASTNGYTSVHQGGSPARGIELLHGVDMELTVELGRTRMAVRDLLALAPGDVLELDRAAGSPADLLVNGRLIARGEVVVVDEDFGLRITQILDANAG